jgi:hypothetical protein
MKSALTIRYHVYGKRHRKNNRRDSDLTRTENKGLLVIWVAKRTDDIARRPCGPVIHPYSIISIDVPEIGILTSECQYVNSYVANIMTVSPISQICECGRIEVSAL